MKRYKLTRVVDGRFLSANTPSPELELEYVVGEITKASGLGIACYKKLRNARTYRNILETMDSFNGGNPVGILRVEPMGKHIPKADTRYLKGGCYEGGVNYPAVKVIGVAAEINQTQLEELRGGK